jgi:hypothetical protein
MLPEPRTAVASTRQTRAIQSLRDAHVTANTDARRRVPEQYAVFGLLHGLAARPTSAHELLFQLPLHEEWRVSHAYQRLLFELGRCTAGFCHCFAG